jgi:hypothetical protein
MSSEGAGVAAPHSSIDATTPQAMPKLRSPAIALSPVSRDIGEAQNWLHALGTGRDGVVAKRLDMPYRAGKRDGMVKIKLAHRRLRGRRVPIPGEVTRGRFAPARPLQRAGPARSRRLHEHDPARGTRGADAAAGGDDRAAGPHGKGAGRTEPVEHGEERGLAAALRPELVVEVRFDHVSSGRFRHGTTLIRFRPDKAPRQCLISQMYQA